MRDIGHQRALHRVDWFVGRVDALDAQFLHEPLFLAGRIVRAAGQCTGVPDRACELGLPATHHAGDDRLAEGGIEFVESARLDVKHSGLTARVIGQRKRELRRGEVDIHVLAAGDERGGAPARHAQIGGDRAGEVAGIGKDRDGPATQCLFGTVAAQCPADAHMLPGIGHAQAVATKDIYAVSLAHRTNLAGIMHSQLLGDNEDFFQLRVHTNQFGYTVARGRWRQVDHTAIETMAVVESLEHVVIDGDVTERRLQHLTAPAGRSAEYHVTP